MHGFKQYTVYQLFSGGHI